MIDLENLNSKNVKLLEKISKNAQKKYFNLLDKLYINFLKEDKLILHPIFSRDDSSNGIYFDLCLLKLVKILINKDNTSSVKTNNKILAKIIKEKYPKLNVVANYKKINLEFLKKIITFLKNVFYLINLYISKSNTRKKKIINNKDEIILIETFYSKNLFSGNQFSPNYQEKILDNLPTNLSKKVFFYPTILINGPLKKYISIADKKLKKQIFCFDFLKIGDYYKSLTFNFSLNLNLVKNNRFEDFQIDELIKSHINKKQCDRSSIISLLNYYFFQRLKESDIKLKLIIDWFENQVIDKGFNLGKNRFYPKVKSKGHMGFVTDFDGAMRLQPTRFEKKLKVLPDEILVCGQKVKKHVSKNLNSLKLKVVPALRNQYLHNLNKNYKNKKKSKKEILIVLSADFQETLSIINILNKLEKNNYLNLFNIKIRLHRQTPKNHLFIKNNKVSFDKDSFINSIIRSDIIITGGSTAALDAFILGKQVLIVGNKNGLSKDPLKNKIPDSYYRVCYNEKEFIKCLSLLEKLSIKSNSNLIIRNKILNGYFLKNNKKNIENFFN